MKSLSIIIFSFFLLSYQNQAPANPVAEKMIDFCKKNMGKKVDRGECWDLANASLNYANAQWEAPYGFGNKIDTKKDPLLPGYIIQFTNVKFVFPNGSASFPKHTAIVYKIIGKNITMFHQNFNNKHYVDTLTINLDKIKNGKIEVFCPLAK